MREAPTTGLGWRPCQNADDGWRESLRFALFAVSRHPRSFLVITALVLVSTALILPAPLISKAVVNLVVNGGDPGRIVTLSGLALAAVAFERFVSYWHGVVIFHRFRCLVRDLRRQLLDHLLRVPLPILQRLEPANLSARIANDSQSVLQAFYDDLISVSESCITSLACMTAMLLIEPRLGLLTLAAAPVYFFLLQRFGGRIRALTDVYYDHGAANNALYYHLLAAPVIAKMHSHRYVVEGYARSCQGVIAAGDAMMGARAMSYAVVLLIGNALPVLILLFSALLILQGSFDLGSFVAFTAFMAYLFPALRRVVEYLVRAQGGAVALRRVNELLRLPVEEPPAPVDERIAAGSTLALREVAFAYDENGDGGRGAIGGVNMLIRRGEPVGVMGRSGAGKTTLLKIIAGLYEPTAGQITIDGRPVAADARRQLSAYVEQEPIIFADSPIENARLGRDDISPEQARQALAEVGLAELLSPGATIEQDGANLSLGQKKRIALARGLLKGAAVIVIDEPTAGLDADNAARAMALIGRLRADRFVVIVSHTMDVMDHCRRLYLVEDGRVREVSPPPRAAIIAEATPCA